ncbi:MAG: hypothetical protein CMN30_24145 [Sandaracinus sp.]|nr:hypothetical protein [Sandaracinus sp.]
MVLEPIADEVRDRDPWPPEAPYVGRRPNLAPMPPYEPGAEPGPRWVSTSVWPMVAWRGEERTWPVFIRGHQTALGTYLALGLAAGLGDDPASWLHATAVLAAGVLLLLFFVGRPELGDRGALLATALLALSWGGLFIARTAYAFEVGSRLFLLAALLALVHRRHWLAGAAGAVAVLMRAPVLTVLLPAALVVAHHVGLRWRRGALAALVALVVPVAVVLILDAVAPFRADAAPLATLGSPLDALPRLGRQVLITTAWLGDAHAILGPFFAGEQRVSGTLPLAAVLGALPVLVGAGRWARGRAGVWERALVLSTASCVVAGAWFYPDENQFQLALALEPLFALALAQQLAALAAAASPRGAAVPVAVALLVFAWRGGTTVRGALASADTAIACFSGRSQHAALARLRELGAEGPRTLTTTYLHVGVPEALIGLHPLHAFELFSASSPADSHQERWTELLRAYRPRHVLHTAHRSLFESDDMYPEAIGRDGLRAAADLGIDLRVEAYPTEAGPTGWEVWTLSYPEGFDVETAAPPESAAPEAAPPEWRGLVEGAVLGDHRVARVTPRGDSAVLEFEDGVVFDLQPVDPDRPPPATVGDLAVLYRSREGVDDETLARRALALAEALGARWAAE